MKKLVALFFGLILALLLTLIAPAQSNEIPHLEKKDGRFALIVDGKPFLVLGGQINNSSAWPATLAGAWSAAEAMRANTVEAPVYWEQMEPTKGTFDLLQRGSDGHAGTPAQTPPRPALVRHMEERPEPLRSGVDQVRYKDLPARRECLRQAAGRNESQLSREPRSR